MATEDKLLNGAGLSHLASDIKQHVRDQAEVYVGSEEPTSGNYKIWIDTEESASEFLKSGDNISLLNNNSGYITSSYHDSTKQNTLTAGSNIEIVNDTINAQDTTYTAGTNITIDANNVISATDTTYSDATTTTSGLMSSTDKTKIDTLVPVSGTNDGTNWSTITIDGTTKAIPHGLETVRFEDRDWDTTQTLTEADITALNYIDSNFNTIPLLPVLVADEGEDEVTGTEILVTDTSIEMNFLLTQGISMSLEAVRPFSASTTWTRTVYYPYVSTATTSNLGVVKPDGSTITISNGVISASGSGEPSAYIKDASVASNTLTLTKKDDTTVSFVNNPYTAGTGITISGTTISTTALTSVPNASSSTVGGIKMRLDGTSLYITNDGTTP